MKINDADKFEKCLNIGNITETKAEFLCSEGMK
jgi:hypothetical protein